MDSRTVRIFLSSTFRDFAEERDLLVRKVFPELRRKCRERQVELVDVDLRWGITEKEAQQGKVLPICLAEIDRSRPYFMGFIGERYGWVPEKHQYDLSLIIEQPWLDEHRGGKSVTELEMLHGVLNNPAMAGRAFFYFRSSAYSRKKGAPYFSEGTEEKAKLEALKDRIRKSRFPVVENYRSPEKLAERVREDLWKLIDESFPDNEVPDALARERMRHEAYSATRRRLYLGGERYFETLDAAMEAKPFRPVLIHGQSGGGKSALLANWVAEWRKRHPKALVIVHHLGCGADAADPVRMTTRLMEEIARSTGDEFKLESDPDKQLEQLPQSLAIASAWAKREKKEFLFVLDGLDKISDRKHLGWFPRYLPPRVKLVASCLEGEILEAAKSRLAWRDLRVRPFTKSEQKHFIGKYLGRYRKSLTAKQTRVLQGHALSGNPLFLLTVLEELRVFGVHEKLADRLLALLSPPSGKARDEKPMVDDVFEHVLSRIEDDLGRKSVQAAMEAIWASRSGLLQDELLGIAKLAPSRWAAIQNALDESIYESGGKISFGHDHLRKAVEDRYRISGKRKLSLHHRLAGWFSKREVDARVADELPWQWFRAQQKPKLRECLLKREMFLRLFDRSEYELLSYWRELGVDIEQELKRAWMRWKRKWRPSVREVYDPVAKILANFLSAAGIYGRFTESLFRDICARTDAKHGCFHEATLSELNSLATLLYNQGNFKDAERIYRRVLKGSTNLLGAHHKDTLMCLNNLGVILSDQALYGEAQDTFCQALQGWRELSGEHGVKTLMCRSNLARVIEKAGDLEVAGDHHKSALAGFETTLGPDHPHTLLSMNNLGVWHSKNLEHSLAEKLYRRALDGYSSSLGPDHPQTLMSVNNLAILMSETGRLAEAQEMCERGFEGYRRSLGPRHVYTLMAQHNLGNFKKKRGDLVGAEACFRDASDGFGRVIGRDHQYTLAAVTELGGVLRKMGKPREAAAALRVHVGASCKSMDELRYNLACYECLSGNLSRAKHLISEHLQSHPEDKAEALNDSDLEAIHRHIQSL
jgi:tetratricopeptide (TPR) repeat protein